MRAAADNLQLATENVNLIPVALICDKDARDVNALVYPEEAVTPPKFNAGTLAKDRHSANILLTVVTAAVLNNGTVVNE